MATIGASYLNLIDMFRNGGDTAIAEVAEVLNRLSPVVRNAFTVEANKGTQHQHSIRTGLPAVTWGRLYQGIPQSKSGRTNVLDTTGFVEGLSTIDTRLLDISPNPAATRMAEAESFLESLRQEVETGIFYHDVATTPEKFKGLAARYNASGGGGAGNQIVKAGGAGSDNTSVWFVTWSENATHLIHPKGTKAGIERQDKGEQRVTDASSNAYYVKEELFRWHVGLAVRDWRYNARIGALMLKPMELEGRVVQSYRGIPIEVTDALLNTESVVA
jgi:hypothetical protein